MKLIEHSQIYINPAAIKRIQVDHIIYEPGNFSSYAEIELMDGVKIKERCSSYDQAQKRVKELVQQVADSE